MQKSLMLFEPEVFVGEDAVTILFEKIPNRHCLYIDIEKDMLFFDETRIKTTGVEFQYTKALLFEKNKGREKKRILTFPKGNEKCPFVLACDCGWDGRIFIKFFAPETYCRPRGKPSHVYSYWHDRRESLKKFYMTDLHSPKKVWPVQYKKDVN